VISVEVDLDHVGGDILCNEVSERQMPNEIYSLARLVRDRKLWRRVEDFRESGVPSEKQESFFEKLKTITAADLVLDSVPPKATKDLEGGAALLARNNRGVYQKTNKNWLDISPVMRALTDEERMIKRIYYRGTDAQTAKAVREKALELEKEKEFTP
jgi:hypothetical protein